MGIFGNLLTGGKEPQWKIGDHRVRKTQIQKRGAVGRYEVTRYKCVDCERKYRNRDKFYDTECYEVIE